MLVLEKFLLNQVNLICVAANVAVASTDLAEFQKINIWKIYERFPGFLIYFWNLEKCVSNSSG
jgi:hypothetical protein